VQVKQAVHRTAYCLPPGDPGENAGDKEATRRRYGEGEWVKVEEQHAGFVLAVPHAHGTARRPCYAALAMPPLLCRPATMTRNHTAPAPSSRVLPGVRLCNVMTQAPPRLMSHILCPISM